jgi:hypothetical protein
VNAIRPAKVRLSMNTHSLGGILDVPMQRVNAMKKYVGIVLIIMVIMSACSSPKPYYKTAKGKKKTKYYNEIQFGGKSASTMKKLK